MSTESKQALEKFRKLGKMTVQFAFSQESEEPVFRFVALNQEEAKKNEDLIFLANDGRKITVVSQTVVAPEHHEQNLNEVAELTTKLKTAGDSINNLIDMLSKANQKIEKLEQKTL